jgi:hypothetical protein
MESKKLKAFLNFYFSQSWSSIDIVDNKPVARMDNGRSGRNLQTMKQLRQESSKSS